MHTLSLLTQSVHHQKRGDGRIGGEFFGSNSKMLPGYTLQRGKSMLGTRLFGSFDFSASLCTR